MAERPPPAPLSPLQDAARAVISAARALLDVAEQIVTDPDASAAVLATIGDLARSAFETISDVVTRTVSEPESTSSERIAIRGEHEQEDDHG